MGKMYDYLVVGAGFFGAVFAREMTDAGRSCLVIDRRDHIGGNCFTEQVSGVTVHRYGPHIFHTNSRRIWDYISKYAQFYPYRHKVKARCRGRIYALPINLLTMHQVWGVKTPEEAQAKLDSVREPIANPANLEQWALSRIGRELYETFIRGYTQKQWGRDPSTLPASILQRLPIRLDFNDDYFTDVYQGIPVSGYTAIFEKLLAGVDVRLATDFFAERRALEKMARKIVYTGRIDRFFECSKGELDWRTLRFETQQMATPDFQGCAIVNYCDAQVPFTRVTEFKHFIPPVHRGVPHTVITREYPTPWHTGAEPYYPINSDANEALAAEYRRMAPGNVLFGGRLGDYRYYDMHQVIGSALAMAERERSGAAHPRHGNRVSAQVGSPAAASDTIGRGEAVNRRTESALSRGNPMEFRPEDHGSQWAPLNYRLVGPAGRVLARNFILHPNGRIYTDFGGLPSGRWNRIPDFHDGIMCGGTVWGRASGRLTTAHLQTLPAQRWRPGALRRRGGAPAWADRVSLEPQAPPPGDRSDFEIVIAKYKEDADWADCYPGNATVYCKDPDDRRFISLPNIGREYGTYLYHIVHRYDSLAEKTLFLQADPFFHRLLPICDYADPLDDFTSELNLHHMIDQAVEWLWPEQRVNGLVKADFLRRVDRRPDIEGYRFTWGAQFAVTRSLIHQHPKSYYRKLYEISQLPEIRLAGRRFDNLHIGFLFEFFWETIFRGAPVHAEA